MEIDDITYERCKKILANLINMRTLNLMLMAENPYGTLTFKNIEENIFSKLLDNNE